MTSLPVRSVVILGLCTAFLVGLCTVFLFTPRVARACSMPRCFSATVLPAADRTIPANAPELVVLLGSTSVDAPEAPRLVGSDGSEIDLEVALERVFDANVAHLRVLRPLVEGRSYRLEGLAVSSECETATPIVTRFFVGPAAPPPLAVGTLRLGEHHVIAADDCSGAERSQTELIYSANSAVDPWQALTFGNLEVGDLATPTVGTFDMFSGGVWRASATCESEQAALTTAVLSVSVAGVLTADTNEVEFDMSCNAFDGCAVSGALGTKHSGRGRAASSLIVLGLVALLAQRRRARG